MHPKSLKGSRSSSSLCKNNNEIKQTFSKYYRKNSASSANLFKNQRAFSQYSQHSDNKREPNNSKYGYRDQVKSDKMEEVKKQYYKMVNEKDEYEKYMKTKPGQYVPQATHRIRLQNGDIYLGQINQNGQFHGQGIYFYKKQNYKYVGAFQRGKPHGKGTLIRLINPKYNKDEYADGEMITYQGDWADGMKNGQGTYFYNDPNTLFEGIWQADIKQEGTYSCNCGAFQQIMNFGQTTMQSSTNTNTNTHRQSNISSKKTPNYSEQSLENKTGILNYIYNGKIVEIVSYFKDGKFQIPREQSGYLIHGATFQSYESCHGFDQQIKGSIYINNQKIPATIRIENLN